MKYRKLGRSDIEVSAVGLGIMTFGAQTDEHEAFRQLDIAFDAGITLYDTAENYPAPVDALTQGRSEAILGKWMKARGVRHKVILATKVAGPGNGPGDMTHIRGPGRCLDRKNISAAVDASLARLQTDVIDLYQVHWSERPITTLRRSRYSYIPDTPAMVPIEETLEALAEQVKAGKIRQIGVCNESPWGVMHYLSVAEARSLPRIASIQNSYSLLERRFESGLAEIALREQVGLIGYSPLASGMLTGKYISTQPIEGSRSKLFAGFEQRLNEPLLDITRRYVAVAEQVGISPAGLALAFAREQPFTTSVLMAGRTAEQLVRNLESLDVELDKDTLQAINRLHDQFSNPA